MSYTGYRSYRSRSRIPGNGGWLEIGVCVVLVAVVLAIAAACWNQANDQFNAHCKSLGGIAHHVTKYAYKSTTTTWYCLSPDGRILDIQ